jgi:hypothetical protein
MRPFEALDQGEVGEVSENVSVPVNVFPHPKHRWPTVAELSRLDWTNRIVELEIGVFTDFTFFTVE